MYKRRASNVASIRPSNISRFLPTSGIYLNIKFHSFALCKASKSNCFDCSLVNKNIVFAFLGKNKAISFHSIEPFASTRLAIWKSTHSMTSATSTPAVGVFLIFRLCIGHISLSRLQVRCLYFPWQIGSDTFAFSFFLIGTYTFYFLVCFVLFPSFQKIFRRFKNLHVKSVIEDSSIHTNFFKMTLFNCLVHNFYFLVYITFCIRLFILRGIHEVDDGRE
mmetsp:Transcript_10411/g.15533  ORF Transcript_10411/g.15533 Transcript_10411/m.15533 type:complete len:220 (-) Transcript_10411:596-1255(-)